MGVPVWWVRVSSITVKLREAAAAAIKLGPHIFDEATCLEIGCCLRDLGSVWDCEIANPFVTHFHLVSLAPHAAAFEVWHGRGLHRNQVTIDRV